ncbi:hypothetical protein KY289_035379 [Solanum tuberosum]|nr:hypothetical protein KY289_035379 [Solanum tuberosum]
MAVSEVLTIHEILLLFSGIRVRVRARIRVRFMAVSEALAIHEGPVRGRVRGGGDSGGSGDTENLNKGKGSGKDPDSRPDQGPVHGCVIGGGNSGGSGDIENLNDKGGDSDALGGSGGSSPNNSSINHDWHTNDEVSAQALSHTQVPSTSPKCPHYQVFQPKPRYTPKNSKGGGGGALGGSSGSGGGGALEGSGGSSPINTYSAHDWHTNDKPVSTQALSHTQVPSTSPNCPHHQVFQPKSRPSSACERLGNWKRS